MTGCHFSSVGKKWFCSLCLCICLPVVRYKEIAGSLENAIGDGLMAAPGKKKKKDPLSA